MTVIHRYVCYPLNYVINLISISWCIFCRLKDEQAMCDIIVKLESYLEKHGTSEEMCRIYLRHIEHLYYKFDPSAFETATPEQPDKTSQAVMDRMCKFIYAKDNTDRLRTRAMLCHIYHHALHDRWYQARDLMVISNLQDNIQYSDVSTQVKKIDSNIFISNGLITPLIEFLTEKFIWNIKKSFF